jgi:aryl-alcohol dehydrogenase-like predicted oxidoreductase
MPQSVNQNVPYRILGRTGERVSAIGLGGWHLGFKSVEEQLSIRIIRSAVDRGITFMDNSWDYNDGASELRMGRALRDGYRNRVFLMTKIDGRSKAEAARQLEESLRRLQTDTIDLVQHHEILRYEDPHRIFDEEGANAALLDARKAGKIRYIGFTGHKDPRIHLYMLEVAREHGFTFDTVQMPLNVMDTHYRSFERLILRVAEAEHRSARNEEPCQWRHPEVGNRHGDRVPPLRLELADLGRHHRDRERGASGTSFRGGADVPHNE